MKRLVSLLNQHSELSQVIAIDGHSASGKTTLARRAADSIQGATLVSMDDFYRAMPHDERFDLKPEEGYERYYDWQRLRDSLLEPFTAGRVSRYQRYDWASNQLGGMVELKPRGILLIEGCYSSRPELQPYYQLICCVETSKALRMMRQKQRDDYNEAWVARWEAAETYHFLKNPPQEVADLVVCGDGVQL